MRLNRPPAQLHVEPRVDLVAVGRVQRVVTVVVVAVRTSGEACVRGALQQQGDLAIVPAELIRVFHCRGDVEGGPFGPALRSALEEVLQ